LQSSLVPDQNAIPSYQAFLVAASALKKIESYGAALKALKGLTTNTFSFEIEYARMLSDSGRTREAVNSASSLSNPRTVVELLQLVGLLMDLRMLPEATHLLQTESGKFDNLQPTILYATLLLEQDRMDELAKLRSQFHPAHSTSEGSSFILSLESATHPQKERLERLVSDLTQSKSPSPLLIDFAQAVLIKGKQPNLACTILLQHPRTNDLAYARELFTAAERARDSDLMRSAAENWYRLSPDNLNAAQNYCAMLAMFDEQPELSLSLATQCLEAAPRSIAGKIDHIAALINNRKFKIADAMLSAIDEAALGSYERSHFNFLRLKSALNAGQKLDSGAITQNISANDLYPRQLVWLEKHGIKLSQ
jgi:F0F1-type ATP synthase delta subunit